MNAAKPEMGSRSAEELEEHVNGPPREEICTIMALLEGIDWGKEPQECELLVECIVPYASSF